MRRSVFTEPNPFEKSSKVIIVTIPLSIAQQMFSCDFENCILNESQTDKDPEDWVYSDIL